MTVTVQGHPEVEPQPDGSLLPRFLPSSRAIGLCLAVASPLDTSQWEARLELDGRPLSATFTPPVAVAGGTLCFEASPPATPPRPRKAKLSATVRDRFDGRSFEIPGRGVRLEPDGESYRRLEAKLEAALAGSETSPTETLITALDGIADEAKRAGLPQLAIRTDLVAVYFLRRQGSSAAFAVAWRKIAARPAWLAAPEAAFWSSQVSFERAALALADGLRLREAWQELRRTEESQQAIAHQNRLMTVKKQAEILARVGAAGEAVARLDAGLADCARWPCNRHLVPDARTTLAWLVALDPHATRDDLDRAHGTLLADLVEAKTLTRFGGHGTGDPGLEEQANREVNLAYLEVLRAQDPSAALARARALLAAGTGSGRSAEIQGWAAVVEAEDALARGNGRKALALAEAELVRGHPPRLLAWAASCVGRAARQIGDLATASSAFARALALHAHATAGRLGLSIALGPGRQAEDTFEAARVALERGQPAAAWELLELLDAQSRGASNDASCTDGAGDASTDETSFTRRQTALIDELLALERPGMEATAERERSLKDRLQELWRSRCQPGLGMGIGRPPRFRAVALADEILLFEQGPTGGVHLARRTPADRRALALRLADLAKAGQQPGDEAVRALLAPFARALLPPDLDQLSGTTSFALHGLLQDVPLAALPVAGDTRPWFGDWTVPVLRPAGGAGRQIDRVGGAPLFVVDPRQDLATDLGGEIPRWYPEARLLRGAEATTAALTAAAADAAWLHVDAHGRFDPAFPELSSLLLADRPLTFVELVELGTGWRFVNLSGCHTGRWPTTADSGRYGLAGLLVAQGVPWVVAARGELDDRLAGAFNRLFYSHLHTGADVPAAFGAATAELRTRFPAGMWSTLLLVGGDPSARTEGQIGDLGTP